MNGERVNRVNLSRKHGCFVQKVRIRVVYVVNEAGTCKRISN